MSGWIIAFGVLTTLFGVAVSLFGYVSSYDVRFRRRDVALSFAWSALGAGALIALVRGVAVFLSGA